MPDDQDVHELSGGAAAVWAELCTPRALPELVSRLAAAHGMTGEEIEGQIGSCLDDLVALGLVGELERGGG